MKYAFMSFSCPALTLGEMIALAEELGYDAIEPRAQEEHVHGVELDATAQQRRESKQRVDDSGIAMCCIATSCRYADPASRGESLENTHRAIDLAADLGCGRVRVFGGPLGEGISRQDGIQQVAEALASAGPHAAQRDVVLCVETHDDWCDPAHVAAVMTAADHPNVAVNWDIMHPVRSAGAAMEQAFEALQPWIRHVHVHDGRDAPGGLLTLLPIGQGAIDHAAALLCLKGMNYDGFISGEWIGWEPHEIHLPRELALLKALDT